jgi:hypothetical protein
MAIRFLDPRAQPSAPISPYEAKLDWSLAQNQPLSIGLLANGFPDSDTFLETVEIALRNVLAKDTVFSFTNKGNASAPASKEMVEAIAANTHAVVTAYGH